MNRSLENHRPGDDVQLRRLWRVVRRNSLLSLGVPAFVLAATLVALRLLTPVYEASSSIRIDERKSDVAVLDILKTLSAGSEVNTEMEVLRSRTLAEGVVDSLGLVLRVTAPRRAPRSSLLEVVAAERAEHKAQYRLRRTRDGGFQVAVQDRMAGRPERVERELGSFAIGEPIALGGLTIVLRPAAAAHGEIRLEREPFQESVRALRREISVTRPNREAAIVVVSYRSSDPALSREVANAMAGLFIRGRQLVQKVEARSAVQFLSEQLDTLAAQLASAEDALRVFRQSEQVVSLEAEAGAQVKRLADMQAQRDLLNSERAALGALLADVATAERAAGTTSQYRRLMAFPTLLRNAAAAELLRLLNEVENERVELLGRRTPQDPDVLVLTGRVSELEEQLHTIARTYHQGLTDHVAALDATLGAFRTELARIPAKEITFARLARQAGVLGEIYTLLQTRLKESEVAAAVEDVSVRVVDPAILPTRPIRPRPLLSLALALLLGVMLGAGAAFAREHLDTTVHSREELQLFGDVAVLGMIPRIADAVAANGRGWVPWPRRPAATRGEPILVVGREARQQVAEAFRTLRTNITFARPEHPPKTLVFTSAMPGDGKSTTATNFALTLAQQGLRCLLVDSDLRRGMLHRVTRAPQEPGLSNVLLGTVRVEDAVHPAGLDGGGNLFFLATGTLPPNPAELVGSSRMRALLEQLEGAYDALILDAPPLNLVTDAALLGTNADGVILVVRAGVTERAAVHYALEQLRNVRAPILGTVLNDIDLRRDGYHRGAYADYYEQGA